MRTLRVMGLGLLLMLTFNGMGAASASADVFEAEKSSVTLTGSVDPGSTDQFLTTVGTVSCTTPKYVGTSFANVTTLTVTPSYAGCTTAGVPSTIAMNGCTFVLTSSGGSSTVGGFDLACPMGQEMTVTVTPASGTHPCTIHIKAQSDISGTVTYSNIGAGTTGEVTASAALSGIDYTHTAGTGLAKCPAGSSTNGTWNFKAVFTGEEDVAFEPKHVGIFFRSV